jgi:hypothetical protein
MHVMCIVLFSDSLYKVPYSDFFYAEHRKLKFGACTTLTLLELVCPTVNLAK